jgi:hypothetical protein
MSQVEVNQSNRQVIVTETVNQPVELGGQQQSVVVTDSETLAVVITPPAQTAAIGETIVQSIVLSVPDTLPTEVITPGPQGPAGEAGVPLSTTFVYTGNQLTSTSNAAEEKVFTYNPDGSLATMSITKQGNTTVTSFSYTNGKLTSTTVV